MKHKSQAGYVALISVLVVGAASLAITLTLLVGGTDSQRLSLVVQQSAKARTHAKSCAEEALQQLRNSPTFTGTASFTLGDGTCSYTVTPDGDNRIINSVGNQQNVVRKINVYVTITASSISITSWQEVG